MFPSIILTLLACTPYIHARLLSPLPAIPLPFPLRVPNFRRLSPDGPAVVDINIPFTFDQLIDHSAPEKGTFKQQYWVNPQWWAGPGAPVVLVTPGEAAAIDYTAFLINDTITGAFAQKVGGAMVMLEHRYFGASSPYDTLTTENLQYLTLQQSIADLTYFANNVAFPFDKSARSSAKNAPWVLSGGSYAGALSAWTLSTSPGTFWAYHASSAPVQAIWDYWQYFEPVQQGMPANCSEDVTRVIDYMDEVLTSGTPENITSLKEMFGLESLVHNDDFMAVLINGPWTWQSLREDTGYGDFYQWCDAIENVAAGAAEVPDANGVGLEKALAGYANYIKDSLPGSCEIYGYAADELYCFDTHNTTNLLYTDLTVESQVNRQWMWLICNELGYWQKELLATEVSPILSPSADNTFQVPVNATVAEVNAFTKGWDLVDTSRLLWINGEFDPWRTSGVSSTFRPGGALASTKMAPVEVIPGGVHCYDLLIRNGNGNAGIRAVMDRAVAQIDTWVGEFYLEKGIARPVLSKS